MKKSEQLIVNIKSNLRKELREIRLDKCMRQTDVAKRMKCSSSNICQFELKKGKKPTSMKTTLKYVKALGFKAITFTT